MKDTNWKKYQLHNLCEITSSKRIFMSDYTTKGIPFFRSKEIIEKSLNKSISTLIFISTEKFESIKLKYGVPQENDLLLTSVGTLGVPYIVTSKDKFYFKDGNLTWFRNFNQLSSNYLYYFFLSSIGQNIIHEISIGSTQKALTIKALQSIELNLPPIEEQKRIAGVLGAFDDKIELLQKQNTTLESMAKALFKSWFVDFDVVHAKQQGQPKAAVMLQYHLTEELYNLFPSSFEPSALGPIPTGWQVKTLGQVSLCFDSKRVPLSNRDRASRRGVYPYFGATSVMDYINDFLFDDIYLLLGEDGSVIKNDGTPFLQYVFGKIWVNNHAHVLQGKEPITTEFLYLFLSDFQIQPYVTGAVQAKLNQKNMNSIPMVIPDKNILNYFNIYAKRLFNKIIHNHKQIQTLTEMRDALLPRLISGKIRV